MLQSCGEHEGAIITVIRYSLHIIIQDPMRYLRSLEQASYMLSKNIKDSVGTIFGFSLYAIPL